MQWGVLRCCVRPSRAAEPRVRCPTCPTAGPAAPSFGLSSGSSSYNKRLRSTAFQRLHSTTFNRVQARAPPCTTRRGGPQSRMPAPRSAWTKHTCWTRVGAAVSAGTGGVLLCLLDTGALLCFPGCTCLLLPDCTGFAAAPAHLHGLLPLLLPGLGCAGRAAQRVGCPGGCTPWPGSARPAPLLAAHDCFPLLLAPPCSAAPGSGWPQRAAVCPG